MFSSSSTLGSVWSKMLDVIKKFWNSIPEPDDIYDAIKPLHVHGQVYSLACYETVTKRALKSYSITALSLSRNILQILLYSGLVIQSYFTEKKLGKDITSKLQYVQDAVSSLLAITQLIMGMVYSPAVVRLFNNIDEVDRRIKNLAIKVPYRSTYVSSIGSVALNIFTAVSLIAGAIYIYGNGRSIGYIILQTLAYSMPYSINGTVEFQYLHYTWIVRERYQLLNKYLASILNNEKVSQGNEWAVKTNKMNTTPVQGTKKTSEDALRIVNSVAALHIKLTDTSLLICHAFCVQLLFLITIAFVGLVVALFLIAMNFSRSSNKNTMSLNIIFTTWAFMNMLQLMSVVYVTCILCEEANKFPRILHKIRNHTDDIPLHDTIETYSLQMYHNRLQFHVCGLFPLDYTLLYTIVAGVTTYLVILIQFNNTESPNISKANFTDAANATTYITN